MGPPRKSTPKAPSSLSDAGKKYWRTFWKSPVAASLVDVDIPALVRLCETYDRLAATDLNNREFIALSKMAAQLEVTLGITAGARARLGIKVHEPKKTTLTSVRDSLG